MKDPATKNIARRRMHSLEAMKQDSPFVLDWQLPCVMPNYPSVTLYYPFLGGNGVTHIRVMVKPLYKSQAQYLDL